jgi:hypothetical protein
MAYRHATLESIEKLLEVSLRGLCDGYDYEKFFGYAWDRI